ncbi:MAG TPA: hypothetical protein VES66_03980 [Terriglobales bacterium]|nr:hypothetical protein [Terriglobales bacterium]
MRFGIHRAAVVLVLLAAVLAFAADKPQTFTGKVSDAMCGAKHMMAGASDADCTRACVKQGSKYALVVGDSVYTLEGGDAAMLDMLAGQNATVSGTLKGKTITVASVAPAK